MALFGTVLVFAPIACAAEPVNEMLVDYTASVRKELADLALTASVFPAAGGPNSKPGTGDKQQARGQMTGTGIVVWIMASSAASSLF
ncbi:MAG TPA: hypothetical protein PK867_26920, partial [Pirellulales bacterium]|nr:hypothetical protein [Pirellulales bacterium]